MHVVVHQAGEITPAQKLVLQTAYDIFRERAQWPTHQYVDHELREQIDVSLWQLLHEYPIDLIQQPPPFGNQDRVKVRVRGLLHCSNAAPDLHLLIQALVWLVSRRRQFQPNPTQYEDLRVTADEFRLEAFHLGRPPTDIEYKKVYELLMGEPLGLGGGPGEFAGDWNIFVPPEILDLAGVATVDQYLHYLDERYAGRSIAKAGQDATIQELLAGPGPTVYMDEPIPNVVPQPSRPRIIIVHGHDKDSRKDVHTYLRELGLQPIVLQDQPNIGRTIIEKVEANSDVEYAVVLITPDDVGREMAADSVEQTRARQNVIFELGFFIGKLGRQKVCLLYRSDAEMPSDLQGVAYVSLDLGSWRTELFRELRGAGIEVDGSQMKS